MAVGRNVFFLVVCGSCRKFTASIYYAGQNLILYKKIPENIQGRVFAVRNAVQYSTIPFGILLGGYLSDYVFEPFMCSNSDIVTLLGKLWGSVQAVVWPSCFYVRGFVVLS